MVRPGSREIGVGCIRGKRDGSSFQQPSQFPNRKCPSPAPTQVFCLALLLTHDVLSDKDLWPLGLTSFSFKLERLGKVAISCQAYCLLYLIMISKQGPDHFSSCAQLLLTHIANHRKCHYIIRGLAQSSPPPLFSCLHYPSSDTPFSIQLYTGGLHSSPASTFLQ